MQQYYESQADRIVILGIRQVWCMKFRRFVGSLYAKLTMYQDRACETKGEGMTSTPV